MDPTTSRHRPKAAVIGLGSMGLGMAMSLLRGGFDVAGYDVSPASFDRLVVAGGRRAASPADAATEANAVVCVVVNARQTDTVLFGTDGAVDALPQGAVVISCATVDPTIARELAARVESRGLHYLDAPMSGGSTRAAEGALSFMASGSELAFSLARPLLEAMASKVHELGAVAGQGSAFKMINQLLAGVHIAVACEAMVFAAHQGLDLRRVHDVITASAGNSWMFENRVPHIIDGDYAPRSAVDIFVKDLGIVQDMARSARFPVPLAAAALQMFLATSGAGMGGDDDASVARLYAKITGTALPGDV